MARGEIVAGALRGLACALPGLAFALPARAAEPAPHLSLRWSAPDACPDDAQLIGAVERYLGQPLAEAREQQLAVTIDVQSGPSGFSATLVFSGPQGREQRALEHPECEKLMEAAALLSALAVDPERVNARQVGLEAHGAAPAEPVAAPPMRESKPPPEQQPCAAPATAREAAPTPAPTPAPGSTRVAMAISAFAGAGALASFGPGFTAEVGVGVGRLRLTGLGRYWFPRSTASASSLGPEMELSLVTAGLRACGRPLLPFLGRWQVLGCAGAELGDLAGSGQGVNDARTRHARYAALEASVFAAYAVTTPAPFAGLGLSWAVARPRFGFARGEELAQTFRPGPLAIMGYLGLSYGL